MERPLYPSTKIQKLALRAESAIISVAGRVLHIIVSGQNGSLEETSKRFLDKTHTDISISDISRKAIKTMEELGKGLIISNHVSGVLSDYLPLFSELGDNILKKTIFYTGWHNLSMNRREFPEYHFQPATPTNRDDMKLFIRQIQDDVQKIKENGGYIFIIPSGADFCPDAPFKAIFQKIIDVSNSDLPMLINRVDHDRLIGHKEIVRSMIIGTSGTTSIVSKLSSVSEWQNLDGNKMREKYNIMTTNL